MTPELMFSLSGTVALVGWISLAASILLRNALLRDTMAGLAIPLALSAAYAVLILVFWWTAEGGFDSLANVQKLFTSPWVALAGWIHYLAFDLAIGALLARKMMAAGLSRLFLIPILPLTFLFGPIGFLLGQAVLLSRKEA
ncbi:MAG: abscisic acid-deficient protein Aba4 family protein [Aestuariivirga sp.]